MSMRLSDTQRSPGRRSFVKSLAAATALAGGGAWRGFAASDPGSPGNLDRSRVRALLMSATTLAGKGSMEHAREQLGEIFGDTRDLLLINFASLPEDRDAYEARMQRDFEKIKGDISVRSLHRAPAAQAAEVVRSAKAFFVSGGNTFLLLRELYDRNVVELLRERVLSGVPYAGSSAGSNIAGSVIGTTNDFPLVDIPTRRSLGILPAVFNPHHPEETESTGFASRQWKIGQYCRYHPEETVMGVTNPGLIRIQGGSCSLVGDGGSAFLQRADQKVVVEPGSGRSLAEALQALARKKSQ